MKYREKEGNRKQHKKVQRMRKLMVISGWLLCVAAFVAGGFGVLGISGKYNLKEQTASYMVERENAVQAVSAMSGERVFQQEELARPEDGSYRYNEDILTFLLMGIHQEEKADTMFLFVLDPHEEAMKLIPINCNTMAAVDIYDGQGVYNGAITAQVGIQYGVGGNKKESCEYQVKAVKNLFYGIHISGYLAVDIEDIPKVMALIEGIELGNIKGLSSAGISAEERLEKQSMVLAELILQGKNLVREDFTIPIRIYNQISGNAVTNITADEVAYLAATAGGYHFDAGQIAVIPGESINDEFYVDQARFHEMVTDIFYEPVD